VAGTLDQWKRAAKADNPRLWATKRPRTCRFQRAGPRQYLWHGLPESERWRAARSGWLL